MDGSRAFRVVTCILAHPDSCGGALDAVSYTHLDVYKRQRPCFEPATYVLRVLVSYITFSYKALIFTKLLLSCILLYKVILHKYKLRCFNDGKTYTCATVARLDDLKQLSNLNRNISATVISPKSRLQKSVCWTVARRESIRNSPTAYTRN